MAVVLCTVCGVNEQDVPALEVWGWFAGHKATCVPRTPPKRYGGPAWQPVPCPSASKWQRKVCSCDGCRDASSEYYRDFNRRRRERVSS